MIIPLASVSRLYAGFSMCAVAQKNRLIADTIEQKTYYFSINIPTECHDRALNTPVSYTVGPTFEIRPPSSAEIMGLARPLICPEFETQCISERKEII
jgi:hypothetical protein